LPFGHTIDDLRRNPELLDDRVIQHPDTATRDGAHRKLFVARHSELPNQKNVQIGVKFLRDLKSNRHATAGKRENDYVLIPDIWFELLGQNPAGFPPIAKEWLNEHWMPTTVKSFLYTICTFITRCV